MHKVYIDPIGDTLAHPGASDQFNDQFQQATTFLEPRGVGDLFPQASSIIKGTIHVFESSGESSHNPETKILAWNPSGGASADNTIVSPTTVLNHELDHGISDAKDHGAYVERSKPKNDKQYDTKEERRVVTGSEQKTARALGEIPKGFVTRKNHKGSYVQTTATTTNNSAAEEAIKKALEEKKKAVNDALKN